MIDWLLAADAPASVLSFNWLRAVDADSITFEGMQLVCDSREEASKPELLMHHILLICNRIDTKYSNIEQICSFTITITIAVTLLSSLDRKLSFISCIYLITVGAHRKRTLRQIYRPQLIHTHMLLLFLGKSISRV